jgi:hypothetical protein
MIVIIFLRNVIYQHYLFNYMKSIAMKLHHDTYQGFVHVFNHQPRLMSTRNIQKH